MKKELNLFNQDLEEPLSNIQEILYDMITVGKVSIASYFYLPGFRMRISELRFKGLKFDSIEKEGENKWKRKYKFMVHILPFSELENAKRLYVELRNNSIKYGQKK